MMMGALKAGGLSLVTDDHRPPDEHNQRGYFEHQGVKALETGNSWLREHRGRAVKVIYRHLYHLPEGLPTRILFMRRDVREVVASQNAMLGEPNGVKDWSRLLSRELVRVERWLSRQPHIEVLDVSHRQVFLDGRAVMKEVAEFLGQGLDVEAMLATVDPSLYRQR